MATPPPDAGETSEQVQYVDAWKLRQLFNDSGCPRMIAEDALFACYLRNTHLKRPETRGEPWCTRGQMIRYVDRSGEWVVEVYQYVRPDGAIGASGVPDPKRLRLGKTIYALDTIASPSSPPASEPPPGSG